MYLIAALSIGFLGSAHCAGMCGPILLAVNQGKQSWKNDVLHHAGRISTYMLFGAIAGALGGTFTLMGWQQGFSIAIGAIMISSVILMLIGKQFYSVENAISRLAIKFSGWVRNSGLGKNQIRFLAGVGNGILPCGLVYLALAGAANTFTPWDGALFMIVFGLGTLPVLSLISKFSQFLSPTFRTKMRKLVPITVFVMGALLVVRGANLGIPYVSPQVSTEAGVANCD
jgi:hypothetical protein